MNPVLHVQSPDYFKSKQGELNRVLSFEGLRLTDEGKLDQCKQARTISEAEAAADQLRRKLIDRGVHADVLKTTSTQYLRPRRVSHRRLEISPDSRPMAENWWTKPLG
jgi:hypothetical protein